MDAPQSDIKKHILIIAGGSGTRFWPHSRKGKPKQLLKIWDDKTLLEHTVERFEGMGAPIWIVTTEELIAPSKAALQNKINAGVEIQFLGEPSAKNTAPCILWGVQEIYKTDPKAVVAVIPADHYIGDVDAFRSSINRAAHFAHQYSGITTLGVKPNRPETGYGYIQVGTSIGDGFADVDTFVEKPHLQKAVEYLRAGNYFWNAGVFVFRADVGLDAYSRCMPELKKLFESTDDIQKIYSQIYEGDAISIDYGVMEVAQEKGIPVSVFGVSYPWSDLGSYTALEEIDKAVKGNVVEFNSASNIVQVDKGLVALLSVNDLVVVKEGDVVLVASKDRCQDIRQLVQRVKKEYPEFQ